MKKILQLSTAALLVSAAVSSAATIAGYDFTSGLGASHEASNVTAGVVDLNNSETSMVTDAGDGDTTGTTEGITFSSAAGNIRATNQNLLNTSRNDAITDGDYFSFTIAPASGFELDLDKIVFSAARAFDVNKNAESFDLMSSITGFETTDTTLLAGTITTVQVALGAYEQFSIDVSGNSSFQNIATSTEFRIYMWNGSGNGIQGAINYDNVGVTGSVVAVPEPSTYATFAGMLAFTSVMFRRRQS